jgi:hypothetical protein
MQRAAINFKQRDAQTTHTHNILLIKVLPKENNATHEFALALTASARHSVKCALSAVRAWPLLCDVVSQISHTLDNECNHQAK